MACSPQDEEKYRREEDLAKRLLRRLRLDWHATSNPNACGKETGIDVLVVLNDGRTIGLQVTVLDPYPEPGKARAQEKRVADASPAGYGGFAQNDRQAYLDSLVRTIKRKTAIAERNSFEALGLAEVWLLVCAGIPEHGAVVSTFVNTPILREQDLEVATGGVLHKSKYNLCVFHPIQGAERALYCWQKHSVWKKTVLLDNIHEVPRAAYIDSLILAGATGDQERDRLCEEEVSATLREMREAEN
jgi:hypothetical protein